MTVVKICGITDLADAVECVNLGVNVLGFIFAESPRRVDPRTVKHIERVVGADVKLAGVFTDESDDVLRIVDDCALTYAQLHGNQSEKFAARVGASRVIRVARVSDEASVDQLASYEHASFYLLDTFRKGQAGGTGETFDWNLALRAKSLGKPIFLSGGLGPDNVTEAIAAVRPYAVDASSRLERSPGAKDITKLKEFIDNVRKADSGT